VILAGLSKDSVTGKKGHGPVDVDTTVDAVELPGSTRSSCPEGSRRTRSVDPSQFLISCGPSTAMASDRVHLPRWLGADLCRCDQRTSRDQRCCHP
jgi:hypothetical protein